MKLTRGQKFPGIDANVYNKQIDMVRNFEAGEPTDSFPPNDKAEDIWIVYPVDGSQGTSNIPCFGIVGLGPLVITPSLSLPGFVESLTVELASPEPRAPFAVLQDPLGYDSAVARNATANVHGITRCKIDVTDEDHAWAAPASGNTTSLLSQAYAGPARVLWKESGTGVVWAVVYLDQSGRTDEPFVAHLDGTYSINAGKIVYKWTEQVWTAGAWADGDRSGSETAGPFLFEINNRVVRLPCYVRAFYRGTLDGQACYDFDRCCGNVLGEGTPAVHTVDALLRGAFTRTHMIDAYLRHNPSINHRLDAYLVNKRTKTHTLDAYLVARRFKTHTTDGYLILRPQRFHTTNAWLANVRAKVHTTDAYLSINGEKTHTTDAWLANLRTKTHTVDAWLANVRAVFHSTDAYLRPLHSVNHATDAYLRSLTINVHDTFTAANGTGTTSRACDTGQVPGASGGNGYSITSNHCVNPGNTSYNNPIIYNAGSADCSVSADLEIHQQAASGSPDPHYDGSNLVFRYVNDNQFFMVQPVMGGIALYVNNSGFTSLGSASVTLANDTVYNVKAVLLGDSIDVYVDGVLKISVTNSSYNTSIFHGFIIKSDLGSGSSYVDEFLVTA